MILGVDTSANNTVIALKWDNQIHQKKYDEGKIQSEKLLAHLDALISETNSDLKAIDYIAIGVGPGSFTGLRVGISFAQGLSFALGIKVVPVSSLACLAQLAYRTHGYREILVAIDARMQEVYWGHFKLINSCMMLQDKAHVTPPELIISTFSNHLPLVGNAFLQYPLLKTHFKHCADAAIEAQDIFALAEVKYQQNKAILPGELVPEYIRDNVAKKSLKS